MFKNLVPNSKKTEPHHHDNNQLEIIVISSKNHTKPINTLCGQNVELLFVKAGGTHSYLDKCR
jgi:hypothetical protein